MILIGGTYTVRILDDDRADTYVGVSSAFKGWTLEHRWQDFHNRQHLTATLHRADAGGFKTYRLQYTHRGRFKVLNHNNGPQYMPKEVRKWIRAEYKVLYVKARLAGWPGITGRN